MAIVCSVLCCIRDEPLAPGTNVSYLSSFPLGGSVFWAVQSVYLIYLPYLRCWQHPSDSVETIFMFSLTRVYFISHIGKQPAHLAKRSARNPFFVGTVNNSGASAVGVSSVISLTAIS